MAEATAEDLRVVPVLATCSHAELQALAEHVRLRHYSPGQEVIRQGEFSAALYIIVRGEAGIAMDGVRRKTVRSGDIVGEISMLGGGEATATVVATSALSTLVLTREDFTAVVDQHGAIALRVITVLVGRLSENRKQLVSYNRALLDYIEQVGYVTSAAAAVETSTFDPHALDDLAARADELGQLARVFQRMAVEVAAREQRLRQEVQRLRITIDQSRAEEQVAAITETEYFQTLQHAAERMRSSPPPRGEA